MKVFKSVCRSLTSGEMSQIFQILRLNVPSPDYQETLLLVINQLLSSDVSWFEFPIEERRVQNKVSL